MPKDKNVPVPMPDEMVRELEQIARENEQSRAAVIRLAVKDFIFQYNHLRKVKQAVDPKIHQAAGRK